MFAGTAGCCAGVAGWAGDVWVEGLRVPGVGAGMEGRLLAGADCAGGTEAGGCAGGGVWFCAIAGMPAAARRAITEMREAECRRGRGSRMSAVYRGSGRADMLDGD